MSNDKMKTQGDLLGEANDTLKTINHMIQDPEAFKQAKKKVDLRKIKKSYTKKPDDEKSDR